MEYSARDGHIFEFVLDGERLYDMEHDVCVEGWEDRCWRWVLLNRGFWCYESLGQWSQPAFIDWIDERVNSQVEDHYGLSH